MAVSNHIGGNEIPEQLAAMGIDIGESIASVLAKTANRTAGRVALGTGKKTVSLFCAVGKTGLSCIVGIVEKGGVSLKELTKNNEALSQVDVNSKDDFKTISKILKKYNVPYNVDYDKGSDVYTITYHAKQADIMEKALKECTKNLQAEKDQKAVKQTDKDAEVVDVVDRQEVKAIEQREVPLLEQHVRVDSTNITTPEEFTAVKETMDKYGVMFGAERDIESGMYTLSFVSAKDAYTLEKALKESSYKIEGLRSAKENVKDSEIDNTRETVENLSSEQEKEKTHEVKHGGKNDKSSPTSRDSKSKDDVMRASDERRMKERLEAAERISEIKNAARDVKVKDLRREKEGR